MRAGQRGSFGCVIVPEDYACIEAAGYDYVELSCKAVCAMTSGAFSALRRMLSSGSLPCLGFNAYCPPHVRIAGPGFSLRSAKAWAMRAAQRAEALGVRVVGVGSPLSRVLPPGYDVRQAWEQATEFFSVTGEAFFAAGILVCVEALDTCYCSFINRLEEAAKLVRLVRLPNVRLLADFYNMERSGEADISLAPYAAHIAHAHISDDAGDPHQRWFLREDKRERHIVRLRGLFAAGYRGPVTVETDLRADPAQAAATLMILRDSAYNI
jgi:sugar phosphate isomerase/epimerase